MSNDLPDSEDDEEKRERFPWQFLLFLVCAVIAIPVYFALATISTETLFNRYTFYIILEMSSYVVIMMTLIFSLIFKRKSVRMKIFVFYRNMNRWGYAWIGLGIASVLALEYFVMPLLDDLFQTTVTFSLLLDVVPSLPPKLPVTLAWVPQGLANVLQQLLWQILSVGHSEEVFKAALIVVGVAVFRKGWKVWVVMGVADLVWACAHAMVAYGANVAAIVMAVTVGLIFLIQLVKTKCVMVPTITHGSVNTLLIIPTMGLTWVSLTTQPVAAAQLLGAALIVPWVPALVGFTLSHLAAFSSHARCPA